MGAAITGHITVTSIARAILTTSNRGFWYAHFAWMSHKRTHADDLRPGDLWKDPLVRLQHRFYIPTAVLMGLLLPLGIACFWRDAWGGLLIAGFLRIVLNHHLTFSINSVCHWLGKQTYSDRHSARDHWLTAFFTYGEGYHNFHHEFSSDYRNGHRFYHWDPTKWLIYGLSRLKLATNLRTCSSQAIASRKGAMQEKRAALSTRPLAASSVSAFGVD